MIKICFVIPQAYSLFNRETSFTYGGHEVRSYHIVTGLSKMDDIEIHFVVNDYGQKKLEKYDKITIYAHSFYKYPAKKMAIHRRLVNKIFQWYSRVTGRTLSINHFKIPYRKYKIYKKINADIYASFGATTISAEIAKFCRVFNKKSIFLAGADEDFNEHNHPSTNEVNYYNKKGFLNYYSIVQADLIITQSNFQFDKCKNLFERDSLIIKNPIPINDKDKDKETNNIEPGIAPGEFVLWVGRSDKEKQPELLLRLAKDFPNITFVMICNRSIDSIHRKVLEELSPNIILFEFYPYHQIERFFKRALFFISTSGGEGFPNTFLLAGKYGTPVLSLKIDPDDFIKTYQCGIVADDNYELFKKGFSQLISNPGPRKKYSGNIFNYVKNNHKLEDQIIKYYRAIKGLVKSEYNS
jgi:glycosyltransferase involved in cell wall biosynthesis